MKIFKKKDPAVVYESAHIPSDPEAQWWLDFLKGDDVALANLYRRYSIKLFSYGRQFTSNETLVQDAIQDVFYTLVDNKDTLGVAQSIKFYLFASFRRALLRSLKKEKRYLGEDDLDQQGFYLMIDPDFFAVDSLLNDSQKKTIEKYCNELPVRQREILLMRFYENMSYVEIAEIMGLANAKTVRTMLYRALSRLAEKLGPHKENLFF